MAYRSGTTTTDGNGTSSVITVPTGAASGDIAVVTIYLESNAAITPPSGFTQKADIDSANAATHGRLIVFWKRLTAADTGSYTFSWTGSTWQQGACVLFSGRSTTGDPFEATSTLTAATDSTPDIPTLTATANADLFSAVTQFNTAATWTAPTGMTTRTSTAGQGVEATATQDAVSAGATGTMTWGLGGVSGFAHGFLGSLPIASSGTTDTARVGGAAWGGVVAASAAGVIALTSLGGLAWSGVRANSTSAVTVTDTARLGSLSWSGVRAQSTADVTHQARVGSLALGGLAPVLSIEDVIDGTGPGALAWSGVRAQSTAVGGGVTDTARVGSAAWSGVPAGSATDVIATGRVGGVTWVGVKAASVADLTNPARPAALMWSGITAASTTAVVQVDTARVGIVGWAGVPASSATTILHQTRVGELAWSGVRASSVASATPTRDVTVTLIRDRSRLVSVTDRSRTVAVRSRS